MKAKYQKPAILEDALMSEDAIMLVASKDGEVIVDNGGNTSAGDGIFTGDSRSNGVWDDDELE